MGEEIEIWKDIIGYNGVYSVSNIGRIRRNAVPVNRVSRYGNTYKSTFKETYNKFTLNRDGYYYVSTCLNGKSKQNKVHRLVAEHFCEKIQGKLNVDHIDGNKLNNHYSNLRWCTHAENIKFAWDMGLYNNIGSNHGLSKLNESQVLEIKRMISDGGRNYIIAKKFNVSQCTICDIRKGRLWKHV